MAKIDLITLSGLTAIDGSVIASGAIVKFETLFFIGTTTIEIRPRVFRTRELFESGFDYVKTIELPTDFKLNVPEAEYYEKKKKKRLEYDKEYREKRKEELKEYRKEYYRKLRENKL